MILSDAKIIEQFSKHKKESEQGLSLQYQKMRESYAFYAGAKRNYSASVNDAGRRSMVNFNHVIPVINAVVGFMVQLRRDPFYRARVTEKKEQTFLSEHVNAYAKELREESNASHIESMQDRDMVITGVGVVDTAIDYTTNPEGDLNEERILPMDTGWDPQARSTNLLDSSYVYRVKKMDIDLAVKMFDAKKEDFESAQGDGGHTEPVFVNIGKTNKILMETDDSNPNLVKVHYYQWYNLEKYFRAPNPVYNIQDPMIANQLAQAMLNIQSIRADEEDDEDVLEDLFAFQPRKEILSMTPQIKSDMVTLVQRFEERFGIDIDFDTTEDRRKVYYTAILSGKKVFQKFKAPDQQGFTVKFKTANYDEESRYWFGLVEPLKEPSTYSNKSLTEIIIAISSNSKGGVLFEGDAVDDITTFQKNYARTDGIVQVNPGALSGGKIQPKAQASLPTGYEKVLAASNDALRNASGVSPEFLGSSENTQVSATLERQRINQVKSTLAIYFDSISLFMKEQAKLTLSFMRILSENSLERMIDITGDDGVVRTVELLQDPFFEEYAVSIEEAPLTAAQQEEKQANVQLFIQTAATLGVPIAPMLPVWVQSLNIPLRDKQQLLQAVQPNEPQLTPEQQQQQQQLEQLVLLGQQAQIENVQADTANKAAQAQNREADTLSKQSSIDETLANTDKLLAEADQKQLENAVIATNQVNELNVNI
jgi:hypothetical protein